MRIPPAPVPQPSPSISPSLYEDLLICRAKAAWRIGGDRAGFPSHPAALLGTAFHAVVEAANTGEIAALAEQRRLAAREIFDRIASAVHQRAHPLMRLKFPSPERLPYYYQQRELAALLAAETQPPGTGSRGGSSDRAERSYQSDNGVITGRPDFLDASEHAIVDYKTGHVEEGMGGVVTERERRQLALYVYLADQSGLDIERGRIVRANGEQAAVTISRSQASAEADAARTLLAEYNHLATHGATFESLAAPTPESCRMCECKPLCEAFWNAADYQWHAACGTHMEGRVVRCQTPRLVQDIELVTLVVDPMRGTVFTDGLITVPQTPLEWFTADGDRPPQEHDLIRVVDGSLAGTVVNGEESPSEPMTIKTNRIKTTVWRVDRSTGERTAP